MLPALTRTQPGAAQEQVRLLKWLQSVQVRLRGSNQTMSRARPETFEELADSLARVREESYRKTLVASVAQDRNAPIENIQVPTLVVGGDEDKVYPVKIARDLAQRIPGAELVIMKGAGHLPNIERPERFNEILLDFLKRRSP